VALSSLLSPKAYLKRNAIRRGLLGGSSAWVVIGVAVWAPRLMRRAFGRTEQVVASEKLVAGQFVRIEAIPTPTRAQRKSARSTK
jgi:hypothetical protein